MIHITYDSENLTILGHSNPGGHLSTREEIEACAAITALSQGLLFALQDKGYGNISCLLESGTMFLPLDGLGHDGLVLVNGFVSAMKGVADGYPEQITVTTPDEA